ncbi:MAG: hypothetical protein ABL918_03565 [Chakrabartia sp.]
MNWLVFALCGCVTVTPFMPNWQETTKMLSAYCGGQEVRVKRLMCYEGEEAKCTFKVKLKGTSWMKDNAIFAANPQPGSSGIALGADEWKLISKPNFCQQTDLSQRN